MTHSQRAQNSPEGFLLRMYSVLQYFDTVEVLQHVV